MSQDFQKQLDSIIGSKPSKQLLPTTFNLIPKIGSFSSSQTTVFQNIQESSIYSKIFYILIAIFAVIIILVVIHYLVHPILPESITTNLIPGMNDSKFFWNAPLNLNQLTVNEQYIGDLPYNYTVMFDIQIDNPTARSGLSRVFINRGSAYDPTKETGYYANPLLINRLIPDFNFIVYCDTISTDMNIAVQTQTSDQGGSPVTSTELSIIKNFPIQKSIRLTIVIIQKSFEVYINGKLYDIKSLSAPLKKVISPINPPITDVYTGITPFGRIKNLRLWRRTLMAKEIIQYGSGEPFTNVSITDTCTK
jgi:hypothetical protein